MKRSTLTGLSVVFVVAATAAAGLFLANRAQAHCQVPCGIYDDAARITQLHEDAITINKAIVNINQLADKTDAQSANQLTRWVHTKEQHAAHIITTVSEYFLTQKVKPVAANANGYEDYLHKLVSHHAVMVAAMKAKQQADPAAATALVDAINQLAPHYIAPADHGRDHDNDRDHDHASHGSASK